MVTRQSSPVRVLLVEDDRTTAKSIVALLRRDPALAVTGSVSNTADAEKILASTTVDVVLFDLVLQRVERSQKITALKKLAPNATFLVLTAYEEPDRVFRALCAGADGYLLKSDRTLPLTTAIAQALQYGSSFSPEVAHTIARYFHKIGQDCRKAGVEELSTREGEILRLLTQGFTNKEIAERQNVSLGAVKKNIKSICHKLQATNRTHAAVRSRLWPRWI
ncbi:MAG TPA: response regulator transcription factor [Verrucomicrobiota bacterium]|nr:hypothetical protein [Verrucomicrobiales bacterium]HRI12441.1 response regulator transcription factor [Verrucomicrobiota bacterium]